MNLSHVLFFFLNFLNLLRKYLSKFTKNASKGTTWTDEQLIEATQKVKDGILLKRGAHKQYDIPSRTLGRRMQSGNMKKGSPEDKYSLKIDS